MRNHDTIAYERPVTRSVSALLTGSSRQPLNGFIGVPHSHVELDGPPLRCRICYSAPNICSSVLWWNFPWRAVKEEERGPLRDARALPPGYPRIKPAGGRWCSNESRMPPQ